MISVRFQGKPFNIMVIQVYALTSNAEEVEQFYEALQDLLELTPKKDFLFIIGDWNAQVESQEREQVTLAAAAAKLLQSCPTLCDPVDGSPLLRRPWDSPGKNTGVGCHFLLQHMKVKSESEVAQSCPTLCNPMDCSLPGSSTHGIFQARLLE